MRWRWLRRAFLALAAVLPLAVGCGEGGPQDGAVTAASLKRDGAKVAVVTGTAAMAAAEQYFGKAHCLYFDTPPDAYLAVEQGKAEAMVFDRHNLEYVAASRPGLVTLPGDIAEEHIVIGVRKGRGALLEEVNGFIRAYRADGTYAEMRSRWFAATRPTMPTIAEPKAPTRTLRVGMEPMSEPTCFMGAQGPTGFDVEMALRLGAALNARIEPVVLPFSGMIAALESGKIDLIISSLNATPERGEKILFSEDYLDTGICVLTRRAALAEGQIASKDQLAGKRVGVLAGTTMDAIARRDLPGCVPVYYNNFADLPIALKSGKVEAFLMEQPQARVLVKQQRGLTFLPEMLSSDAYAVLFAKDRAALCEAFSAEIRKMKADGTLEALDEKWFSNDPARQTLPPRLEQPPKGTLRFATVAELEPFSFMRGDEVVGYDIEVVQRAAAALGYAVEPVPMDFAGYIPAVASGKVDFGVGCTTITEERRQTLLFSEPNYQGGVVIVVAEPEAERRGFVAGLKAFGVGLKESFERTFVREGRWRLIAQGLWVTVEITICAAVVGTLLAFGLCAMRRSRAAWVQRLAKGYVAIMQGTPTLVLLMILYYVVFGRVDLSAVAVAILGFALNFAAYAGEMFRSGIEGIPRGQTEAALALGFARGGAFLRVILPQLLRRVLPVYKGEFISMLKMTSIVGYIAIQDLTKMSDLIRSRTYEAFFPLIATAVIYFLIAHLLASGLSLLEFRLDPRKRRAAKGGRP